MSTEDFLKLDEKYAILNYVAECPDIFDTLTGSEMVREVEQYVAQPARKQILDAMRAAPPGIERSVIEDRHSFEVGMISRYEQKISGKGCGNVYTFR